MTTITREERERVLLMLGYTGSAASAARSYVDQAEMPTGPSMRDIDRVAQALRDAEAKANTARLAVESVGSETLIEESLTSVGVGASVPGSPDARRTMFGRVNMVVGLLREERRRASGLEVALRDAAPQWREVTATEPRGSGCVLTTIRGAPLAQIGRRWETGWVTDGGLPMVTPTHWMPLPAPPAVVAAPVIVSDQDRIATLERMVAELIVTVAKMGAR